jgi:hypothetical protein
MATVTREFEHLASANFQLWRVTCPHHLSDGRGFVAAHQKRTAFEAAQAFAFATTNNYSSPEGPGKDPR